MAFLFAGIINGQSTPGTSNLPRSAFGFTYAGNMDPSFVTVDARGNTYLAGSVRGTPFTATPGAYQTQNNGGTCFYGFGPFPANIPCRNVFVIKLDSTEKVVFATYLGDTTDSTATSLAADSAGNVYVAGTSAPSPILGTPFPITPGAAFTKGNDFVVKLNVLGTRLEYSTLIPGAILTAIAVDKAGSVYFTGGSLGGFPSTPGAFQLAPPNSVGATIVGKLNPAGSALLYGTYLSGASGPSDGVSIAIDDAGNAFVAGTNEGPDFPATAGKFSTSLPGHLNVYLAKLNPDGSGLIFSTLLGPALTESMKVAKSGDIYIGCITAAPDFPYTPGGFGPPPADRLDADFLLHVSADGSTVLNSTYLPFALTQTPAGLDVDVVGNAYVAGNADRSLAPNAGAFQAAFAGSGAYDTVVSKIAPSGAVAGVTFFGPGGVNSETAIAAERDGSVIVTGLTREPDFLGTSIPPLALGMNFFLTANFFPAITLENAASYVANVAVPGEIISIRGYGIGPATGLVSSPTSNLGGVQVYFDNFPAPIIYAQANQVNAQVPWEIAGQVTTQLKIVYNGANAGSVTLPVGQALPGVFSIANTDGSLNSSSNPAHPGAIVAVYGTGGGAMIPSGVTGGLWPLSPLSRLAQSVFVIVGEEPADVLYSGSAPTQDSGFFQINAAVPVDLTTGEHSLYVTVGGVGSAAASLWIQ
jgi:uncharacterized protein (TIGR03437 family)